MMINPDLIALVVFIAESVPFISHTGIIITNSRSG